MPTSNLALWPSILNLTWEVPHTRVLDVGPGWGKAGILLREYVGVETVDAVESWPAYVTPRLRALYDTVLECDVRDVATEILNSYDVVLMVDVIEHLTKEDGLALLARTRPRVVVCTPQEFFQNPEWQEIPPEEHRSVWTRPDFDPRIEVDASALGGVLVRLGPLTDPTG